MGSKVVVWNGVSSATIPELIIGPMIRDLIGAQRGAFVDIPGKDGSYFFSQNRGRRKFTAECSVLAATSGERRDVLQQVANWLDVEYQANLQIGDDPGVYYEAVVAEAPQVTEWRERGMFELSWLVNPYALDNATETETWSSTADTTHTWDPELEVMLYPVISVTPTNGTLTGFTLTVNGYELYYVGNIADDATVVVNSIAAMVTSGPNTDTALTGTYDPADSLMLGVGGQFPVLVPNTPSDNSVRFVSAGGTATAITIEVLYRKRYRR